MSVTEGESFTFSCGPSNDPLELISVTLNDNEPPQSRIYFVNESDDGVRLYQYRNTTIDDHNTIIVCTAGSDRGVIQLSVFCKCLTTLAVVYVMSKFCLCYCLQMHFIRVTNSVLMAHKIKLIA